MPTVKPTLPPSNPPPVQPLHAPLATLAAAIAFYTCLPVPAHWQLEFQNVARLAPVVGVVIGGLLAGLDVGLQAVGIPVLTRSAVIVVMWVGLTGGLHLDGAMDTADGLAVTDPERRLSVMADSVAGAFGVMGAIALLLLKTTALTDLSVDRGLGLVLAAGWGRVGQQVAIARYPYLKPTGKGAFHQAALTSVAAIVPSLLLLLGIGAIAGVMQDWVWWKMLAVLGMGGAIAVGVPAWFNRNLGGHTGDTYGAVVEWTEAIFLVVFMAIAQN